ncbi:MAG: hypothetical protein R2877_08420 [Bdellovibrionota bacterium]
MVPLVPILGVIVCSSMIYGGWPNWIRLGVWMVIGIVHIFWLPATSTANTIHTISKLESS